MTNNDAKLDPGAPINGRPIGTWCCVRDVEVDKKEPPTEGESPWTSNVNPSDRWFMGWMANSAQVETTVFSEGP